MLPPKVFSDVLKWLHQCITNRLFVSNLLGVSRIGDARKVCQVEMLPDEQLLVVVSGKIFC